MKRSQPLHDDLKPEIRAWWVTALMFLLLLLLALVPGCGGGRDDDQGTGQHGDRGSLLMDALWIMFALALGLLA